MNLVYSVVLLAAAGFSVLVATLAWQRRRQTSAALPMAIFNLAMAWWAFSYALHWSAVGRPVEFFWLDLTYLGVVVVPTAFLAFALCYTARCHWFTPPVIALLSIEPLLTLFLLFTDEQFGLFFGRQRPPGTSAILNGGVGFWVNIFYSYVLIFIALAIIYHAYRQSLVAQRKEHRIILLAAMVPMIADIAVIFGFGPCLNFDLTPVAFTLTNLIFAYGIFRQGFLDLIPMARGALMANMTDGVLVLDRDNRIVDINPSGMHILGLDPPPPIGKPIKQAISHRSDLLSRYLGIQEGQDELMLPRVPPEFFDVRITPIRNREGTLVGRLISFRDITHIKETEMELRRANQRLQLQLAEIKNLQEKLREQAIRDPLTGLYNRRYLNDVLARELHRAGREGISLCLVLLDIDHFKHCNDTRGHQAGDLVLQALANLLMETTRQEDIVCRYGGEEFLVVLPNTRITTARQRAEFWRQRFQDLYLSFNGSDFNVTFSAGIACYPVDGETVEQLVRSADEALYKAKNAGRNRVSWLESGSHSELAIL